MPNNVLITAEELSSQLERGAAVTILDVRWRLDQPDGREAYAAQHIPGAVYVSLDDELSDHTVTDRGRHPLPSGAALQEHARRWGIRQGVPVVVYDDWNRAGSARAWWVLTAAGLTDVRILDGGLSAWLGAGYSVESDTPATDYGDVELSAPDLYVGARKTLTADQLSAREASTVLLDARAPERYRGETEPVDPVAGHIPGARNAPSTGVLAADGTFRSAEQLRELFGELGVTGERADDVGVYCGSGVTASVVLAALAAVGVDAALFPGSWSQWSGDAERPVAVG